MLCLIDSSKTEGLTCYCNKTATLECSTCAQIHGKSPVLFCDDCCVLLEAIHDEMYHKLELSPIKAVSVPSICLELSAVICLRAEKYSAFLRKPKENGENINWVFIEDFIDGKPRVKNKLNQFVIQFTNILFDFLTFCEVVYANI